MSDDQERRRFPRHPCNGQFPGAMETGTGQPMVAKSVDVSKYGLGILTTSNLPLMVPVFLVTDGQRIEFHPVIKRRDGTSKDNWFIGLKAANEDIDCEALFDKAGLVVVGPEAAALRKRPYTTRASRFVPSKRLEFSAGLLGTRQPYFFFVENISRSGLLLSRPLDEGTPFRINTLLDLELDCKCNFVARPVRCTGKVVRMAEETAADANLITMGIAISDPDQNRELATLIKAIEESVMDS